MHVVSSVKQFTFITFLNDIIYLQLLSFHLLGILLTVDQLFACHFLQGGGKSEKTNV